MTEGGSAASDQIGLEMGSPPSAFGISPARGAKGTYSKVSERVPARRLGRSRAGPGAGAGQEPSGSRRGGRDWEEAGNIAAL